MGGMKSSLEGYAGPCVRCSAGLLAVIGGALMASVWSRSADADPVVPSYMYGIDDSNQIYQINAKPGEQGFNSVYNTALTNQSNAFAFDRDRDQMFFLNRGPGDPAPQENNLWMWNKPLGTFHQIATGSNLGINGVTIPANAAYYNDAFWFFREGTFNLSKAALSYSGAAIGTVPSLNVVETFAVTPTPDPSFTNNFGDIAINIDTGVLYASTSRGVGGNFYSLNLATAVSGTVGGFTMIKQGLVDPTTSGTVGLQIAFNEDYSVLYGHNFDDGKWFEIDTADGTLTDLKFVTLIGTGEAARGFRDIGGSSVFSVPEPASIILAAAGFTALGVRLSRRRRS